MLRRVNLYGRHFSNSISTFRVLIYTLPVALVSTLLNIPKFLETQVSQNSNGLFSICDDHIDLGVLLIGNVDTLHLFNVYSFNFCINFITKNER